MELNTPLLSVVIVSYYAKYYLYTTLQSLSKISNSIPIEVIVVNNAPNPIDFDFDEFQFTNFQYIQNPQNFGFSKANNIGVNHANAKNILILNPDTIISEETIKEALNIINDKHVAAVKLVDGFGQFLPESYRSFPNIISSFFKMLPFSDKITPKKNSYYNGLKGNEIEVLSGACFFITKELYESIDGFDERFFMYGEDIDFSFKLKKAGVKIRYIENLPVVHFKGKSSQKTNWSYINSFYNAMKIYWKKNLKNEQTFFSNLLIQIAIPIFKVLSWLKALFLATIYPILDFSFIYLASILIAYLWSHYYQTKPNFFPVEFFLFVLPIYILGWLFAFLIQNIYNPVVNLKNYFQAILWGIGTTFFIYYVLPSDYKYSRAFIFFFILIASLTPALIRMAVHYFFNDKIIYRDQYYLESQLKPKESDLIKINKTLKDSENWEIVSKPNAKNYILDTEKLSNQEIIQEIINQDKFHTIWLYNQKQKFMLQSLGQNQIGYVLAYDTNYNISRLSNRVQKRLFDILTSISLLLTGWFLFLFSNMCFFTLYTNSFKVFMSINTWNSIDNSEIQKKFNLKKGVFNISQEGDQVRNFLKNHSILYEFYLWSRAMFILK